MRRRQTRNDQKKFENFTKLEKTGDENDDDDEDENDECHHGDDDERYQEICYERRKE